MNDDTINRQAAIDVIAGMEAVGHFPYATIGRLDALLALNRLPSAERHGYWEDYRRMGIDGTFHWFRQCSECLYEREDDNEDKDTPYCPNCGAKMDLERSDRMTTNDGYTIIQYPTENTIVITLPQRWDSLTNTFVPVSDRRKCLSGTEEAALLATVKAMFENGAKMDEDNATPHTECVVNLYTETKLRFVLDECIKDEELIEKILKALDEVEE